MMKKTGLHGAVAAAIVCVVATALPATAGAATSAKCSSKQVDIGGTCTSKAEVSKQIVSLTEAVMKQQDARVRASCRVEIAVWDWKRSRVQD